MAKNLPLILKAKFLFFYMGLNDYIFLFIGRCNILVYISSSLKTIGPVDIEWVRLGASNPLNERVTYCNEGSTFVFPELKLCSLNEYALS